MKTLNRARIRRAYLNFLGNFCLLLLGLLAVVGSYFGTLHKQIGLVGQEQENQDKLLFNQRLFRQGVDSIYAELADIDRIILPLPDSATPAQEQALARQLTRNADFVRYKGRSLNARIAGRRKGLPNEVYRRLVSRVPLMLSLKDSIAHVAARVRRLKRQLNECRHVSSQENALFGPRPQPAALPPTAGRPAS